MLHSLKELIGTGIKDANGEVGKVADLTLDDQTWTIHDLVIETSEELGGGQGSVAASAVEIDRHSSQLQLSLSGGELIGRLQPDPSLHSAREILRYQVQARDGEIGHLDDFLVDQEWAIRYMVLDTGRWLPGRKVLFAAAYVENIDHTKREVEVDLSRETVKNGPEYQPGKPIEPEVENSLYRRVERPGDRGRNGHRH